LTKDAKWAIDLVRASGIHDRQGVVLLVFDAAEGDMHGYINVDPILAAMALVSYLEQRYPRTKGPKDGGTPQSPRKGRRKPARQPEKSR
jgi:hypothetical protein